MLRLFDDWTLRRHWPRLTGPAAATGDGRLLLEEVDEVVKSPATQLAGAGTLYALPERHFIGLLTSGLQAAPPPDQQHFLEMLRYLKRSDYVSYKASKTSPLFFWPTVSLDAFLNRALGRLPKKPHTLGLGASGETGASDVLEQLDFLERWLFGDGRQPTARQRRHYARRLGVLPAELAQALDPPDQPLAPEAGYFATVAPALADLDSALLDVLEVLAGAESRGGAGLSQGDIESALKGADLHKGAKVKDSLVSLIVVRAIALESGLYTLVDPVAVRSTLRQTRGLFPLPTGPRARPSALAGQR